MLESEVSFLTGPILCFYKHASCYYGDNLLNLCFCLQFFSPIQPVRCEFDYGDNGRPSGEANVDFATHQEAVEAMQKHKCNMRKGFLNVK